MRQGRSLPKILDSDEIEELIREAEEKDAHQAVRLECLIVLAYASGMRIFERVGLRLDAVACDPA